VPVQRCPECTTALRLHVGTESHTAAGLLKGAASLAERVPETSKRVGDKSWQATWPNLVNRQVQLFAGIAIPSQQQQILAAWMACEKLTGLGAEAMLSRADRHAGRKSVATSTCFGSEPPVTVVSVAAACQIRGMQM
jgi:hypothetical protein